MLNKWVDGLGEGYHNAVWRAVIDTQARAVFRRDQEYTNILGVAEFFGRRYLELIDDASILNILSRSESADQIDVADLGLSRVSAPTRMLAPKSSMT